MFILPNIYFTKLFILPNFTLTTKKSSSRERFHTDPHFSIISLHTIYVLWGNLPYQEFPKKKVSEIRKEDEYRVLPKYIYTYRYILPTNFAFYIFAAMSNITITFIKILQQQLPQKAKLSHQGYIKHPGHCLFIISLAQ